MVENGGAEPQAILSPLTEAAMFLVLTISPGYEDELRDVFSDVSGLVRSVGFRSTTGGLCSDCGAGLVAVGACVRLTPPGRLAPLRGVERPPAQGGGHRRRPAVAPPRPLL